MLIDIHTHVEYKEEYDIENVMDDMIKHGVDKRVISSINGTPIHENNVAIDELVSRYPDKLIGCAVINPKTTSSIEDTERALNLKNIKMFEFNPYEHGYFPDLEENLDIILDKINLKGFPVKVFTGISSYGIPQQWEKYIEKYKNIKFIFLHMGCFDYGYSCVDVVARHANAYTEISNQYELQILRKAIDNIDNEKILFGTTFPERLTSSSLKVLDTLNITEEEKKNIYYKNAKELLEE